MSVFITFEGIDGAGKSTQIGRLQHRLQSQGQKVLCTREPGGTTLGDGLRTLLLTPTDTPMVPQAEALLYAASRAQVVHQVILPALARGEMVLCDRYVDASLAYQAAGLGLPWEDVWQMNQLATSHLQPDLTFLFDIPVATSLDRVRKVRGEGGPDRIEQRDEAYFTRVREAFLRIAKEHPERVVTLDASKAPDELEQEIWKVVANRLETRR
ncbi:dTMP kinase [Alicyclobacillus contaminans]|uniref:dTMP kinase n=1 Tax=Alicyclobacillus contaminans TaxID=392016 RepID=UPI000553A7B6|nr:dTMP kinase [Alicyclobacillus contaminans]